jgi:glycosyltransferase involved in cell wall biosynthesis
MPPLCRDSLALRRHSARFQHPFKAAPTRTHILLLTPVGGGPESAPSGVAAYSVQLLRKLPPGLPLQVLAERGSTSEPTLPFPVLRAWSPDWRFPLQVEYALLRSSASIVHAQHEFRLYGGVFPTALLILVLRLNRRRSRRVVITLHGVVPARGDGAAIVGKAYVRMPQMLARFVVAVAFRMIASAADRIVVHGDYFKELLVRDFGVPAAVVTVIPHGLNVPSSAKRFPESRARRGQSALYATPRGPYHVLVVGFLAPYKQPELVVALAETGLVRDVHYTFAVGLNPRVRARKYLQRYDELRRRVSRCPDVATWAGFVPDHEMEALFGSSDLVVLPYTDCVATSGIASWANAFGVPICYSDALTPIFGTLGSEYSFHLTPSSLAGAIEEARRNAHRTQPRIFSTWEEAAQRTVALWSELVGPVADVY